MTDAVDPGNRGPNDPTPSTGDAGTDSVTSTRWWTRFTSNWASNRQKLILGNAAIP